jgi:hypothetical protein
MRQLVQMFVILSHLENVFASYTTLKDSWLTNAIPNPLALRVPTKTYSQAQNSGFIAARPQEGPRHPSRLQLLFSAHLHRLLWQFSSQRCTPNSLSQVPRHFSCGLQVIFQDIFSCVKLQELFPEINCFHQMIISCLSLVCNTGFHLHCPDRPPAAHPLSREYQNLLRQWQSECIVPRTLRSLHTALVSVWRLLRFGTGTRTPPWR